MNIPKSFAKKVERYTKAAKIANTLYEEIEEWLRGKGPDWEDVNIIDVRIVDKPDGEPCGNGEYKCTRPGCCEDDYSGKYYYPIPDSDKYIEVCWAA